MADEKALSGIDEYINLADPEVRDILRQIRKVIGECVLDAEECISYQIPAFKQGRPFIYFAAFKHHIGVYPPVTDDAALIAELSEYRNAKGNLSFPLKQPIPYGLIGRVAKALSNQYANS